MTTESISRITAYRIISNIQQSEQVRSIVTYLTTLSIGLTFSNILSAQVKQDGPFYYYQLVYRIADIGYLTTKSIESQLTLVQSLQTNEFALANTSYINLGTPAFVTLQIGDIKADVFIREIAQYLLNQNYAMLNA